MNSKINNILTNNIQNIGRVDEISNEGKLKCHTNCYGNQQKKESKIVMR